MKLPLTSVAGIAGSPVHAGIDLVYIVLHRHYTR